MQVFEDTTAFVQAFAAARPGLEDLAVGIALGQEDPSTNRGIPLIQSYGMLPYIAGYQPRIPSHRRNLSLCVGMGSHESLSEAFQTFRTHGLLIAQPVHDTPLTAGLVVGRVCPAFAGVLESMMGILPLAYPGFHIADSKNELVEERRDSEIFRCSSATKSNFFTKSVYHTFNVGYMVQGPSSLLESMRALLQRTPLLTDHTASFQWVSCHVAEEKHALAEPDPALVRAFLERSFQRASEQTRQDLLLETYKFLSEKCQGELAQALERKLLETHGDLHK